MRFHFHRWETVRDTGVWIYQVCKKCGKRRIREGPWHGYGYQPCNTAWLEGRGELHSIPPTGGSNIMPPRKGG